MRHLTKVLLILLLLFAVLTAIAYTLKNVQLLSFIGLLLVFICFLLFFIAQPVINIVDKSQLFKNGKYTGFLSRKALDVALFVRGVFLSIGIWIASLYFSLMEFDISKLIHDFQLDISLSLLGSIVTIIDSYSGGSIKKQSFLTKIVTTAGLFSFLRNMSVLLFGIGGYFTYKGMRSLFSSPLWFLDRSARDVMGMFTFDDGLMGLFIISIFSIVGITALLKEKPRKGFEHDAICFKIGGLIFFIWLFSVPIFMIYILLFYS